MGNPSRIKNSIVLVSFPFDDFSTTKVRPVLCLTSGIGKFEQIVVAFISSKVPTDVLNSDIIININTPKGKGTGLVVDSIIRLHKIATIPKSIIRRKLGEINEELLNEVTGKLKMLFDLQ